MTQLVESRLSRNNELPYRKYILIDAEKCEFNQVVLGYLCIPSKEGCAEVLHEHCWCIKLRESSNLSSQV